MYYLVLLSLQSYHMFCSARRKMRLLLQMACCAPRQASWFIPHARCLQQFGTAVHYQARGQVRLLLLQTMLAVRLAVRAGAHHDN